MATTSGVIYFNSGTSHLLRLLVSLRSLRQFYNGPVAILNAGGDRGIAARIGADLDAEVRDVPPVPAGRNSHYVAKASLWRQSPFDCTLLLDADTLVVNEQALVVLGGVIASSVPAVFPAVAVTQFSNWTTATPIIRKRLLRWSGIAMCRDALGKILSLQATPCPAINTGVIAWHRDCPLLPRWERLTQAGRNLPLTDELAMQIIVAEQLAAEESSGRRDAIIFSDCDWFNRSPIYGHCPPEQTAIWHFHGGKHQGHYGWIVACEEVRRLNLAGVNEW